MARLRLKLTLDGEYLAHLAMRAGLEEIVKRSEARPWGENESAEIAREVLALADKYVSEGEHGA